MRPARDWEILREMRQGFLHATDGLDDYWKTPAHLGLYDEFFAERIGWKWDAVLAEMVRRSYAPGGTHLIDWGCGTGIATRRFLGQFPGIKSVTLWDRSFVAMRFAAESVQRGFSEVTLVPWVPRSLPEGAIFLLSHVLNELPEDELGRLLTMLATHAETVVWVEPGTYAASHRLIAVREQLRAHFSLLAPCPYQARCGLLVAENAPHWCHFFTRPPAWAHHDPAFSAFARELEIDLSSVPYSYLVLGRMSLPTLPEMILGHPRFFKGHAKLLRCGDEIVIEKSLQKRDDPAGFKALLKER